MLGGRKDCALTSCVDSLAAKPTDSLRKRSRPPTPQAMQMDGTGGGSREVWDRGCVRCSMQVCNGPPKERVWCGAKALAYLPELPSVSLTFPK